MPQHPEVLWAQRSSETDETKNILYVSINLPDIKPETLKYELKPTSISFSAKAGNADKGIEEKDYAFDLDFFAEVDPENSKQSLTSRHFALIIRKKEKKAEFWPRLMKDKIRTPFIKTDFSKWVDEDEQDGDTKIKDDDFDMANMGGMPGMGGMGGMGGMPGMGGMGGMPGMGGMGGMDLEKMMAAMGGAGGMGAGASGASHDDDGADVESDDDDDDGPPPLEDAAPKAD